MRSHLIKWPLHDRTKDHAKSENELAVLSTVRVGTLDKSHASPRSRGPQESQECNLLPRSKFHAHVSCVYTCIQRERVHAAACVPRPPGTIPRRGLPRGLPCSGCRRGTNKHEQQHEQGQAPRWIASCSDLGQQLQSRLSGAAHGRQGRSSHRPDRWGQRRATA
jgi:hypothetical protein